MKVLKTYIYSHEAHLDLAKLQDEGIEAQIMDDNVVSLVPFYANAVGGIKLVVYEEDFERASKILDENNFQDLVNEFSDDYVEKQDKCPNCESSKIIQKRSWLSGLLFLLLFSVPFSLPKSSYFCLECKHSWGNE